MMTDYTPIDCGLHSQYELAIMQRQRLQLSWTTDSHPVTACTVLPVDIFTRAGQEFLQVRDEKDREHTIRLDRITACSFPTDNE
jgi:Rho-binding antiterminator